jgi:predicted nucleic acid-binding Zn ribbon protein
MAVKVCLYCGKPFKRKGKKFCSFNCYWNYHFPSRTRLDLDKIITLLKAKKTLKEIAKELKVGEKLLQRFLKRNNVDWRNYRRLRKCVVCGKEFISPKPKLTCSFTCQSAYHKQINKLKHDFFSNNSKWADMKHHQAILKAVDELMAKGFRCVPVHWRRPNIVAFKDGKVYLVEVYRKRPPNLARFLHIRPYVDEFLTIKLE